MPQSSWKRPPLQNLNYTRNCTTLADYISEIIGDSLGGEEENVTSNNTAIDWALDRWTAPSTETVASLLRGALPPAAGEDQPNNEDLMKWYLDQHANMTEQIFQSIDATDNLCKPEVCAAIGFNGNNDLVGQGVIISYITEVVLLTLYSIATIASLKNPPLPETRHVPVEHNSTTDISPPGRQGQNRQSILSLLRDRILTAFRASLADLKRSAAIFALLVSLASFSIVTTTAIPQTATSSPFEALLAILASLLAALPVFVLTLLENWTPTITTTTMSRQSELSYFICFFLVWVFFNDFSALLDHKAILIYQPLAGFTARVCLDLNYATNIVNSLLWGYLFVELLVVLVVVGWAATSAAGGVHGFVIEILKAMLRIMEEHRSNSGENNQNNNNNNGGGTRTTNPPQRARSWRSRWRAACSSAFWYIIMVLGRVGTLKRKRGVKVAALVVALLMTYAALVIMLLLRAELRFTEESSRWWSFGQVLAVGTWAPVLVEWCVVFFCGMKEGLESRMPIEYQAQYVGPTNVGESQPLLPISRNEDGRVDDRSSSRDEETPRRQVERRET